MALTGTASRAVLKDLQRELKISEFEAMITPTSFDRAELNFFVVDAPSRDKENLLIALLVKGLAARFGVAVETFNKLSGKETMCGLVFTPWAQGEFGAWDVAECIRKRTRLAVAPYSGKRPRGFRGNDREWAKYKRGVERSFKKNRLNVLVSTKAFGMGIDKPNIRYTIHYGIPGSIEAFYQEAGRAGRNRRPAWCGIILSEDSAKRNQVLLNPSTSVEQIIELLEDRSDDDDVTRSLYFLTKAFCGVHKEMERVDEVLQLLGPLSRSQWKCLAAEEGEKQGEFEKVLHRLVVIGVVEDYTVNYSSGSFDLRVSGASRNEVLDAYSRYVTAFSAARAMREREKAEQVRDDSHEAFVRGMLELYLNFVYDVIERGRRRALAEMLAAAKAKNSDEFRSRILRYLEATEYSEQLEAVLEDPLAGMQSLIPMLDDVLTPYEAAEVRGQVARYLETYPDHPALLYLRAMSESMCKDTDWQTVWDNLDAWLISAIANYSVPDSDMIRVAGYAIRRLGSKSPELSARLEEVVIREFSSDLAIRELIEEAGVESLEYAPWILLNRLVAECESLTSHTAQ